MKIKSEIGLKGWAVSLGLLFFILGCAKVEQVQGGAGEISYNVISNISTKAAQPYPTTSSFASWAWYLPDGSTWASNHTSSSLHINAAEISYDSAGKSWHDLSTTHYWPKAGTLTFFALSPYSAAEKATCDNANGITLTWDADKNIDIMTAELAADYNNNTTSISDWVMGVPTVFHHKLAQVVGFTFNTQKDYANGHTEGNYVSGDILFFVKDVKIKNYSQNGIFHSGITSSSNGLWRVDNTKTAKNYTWYSSSTGIQVPYSTNGTSVAANSLAGGASTLMLLPQVFSNLGTSPDFNTVPNLEITYLKRTYNAAGTYSDETIRANASLYDVFSASFNRIVMNRQITFKITFNLDSSLIYWAPDCEDWTDGEFNISI